MNTFLVHKPPWAITAQEVSLGTTHNHVVPFAYFSKDSTIDLLSFILRMNDKRYSLAIKPAVVGSARKCSACERKNQVESTFGEDTKKGGRKWQSRDLKSSSVNMVNLS